MGYSLVGVLCLYKAVITIITNESVPRTKPERFLLLKFCNNA